MSEENALPTQPSRSSPGLYPHSLMDSYGGGWLPQPTPPAWMPAGAAGRGVRMAVRAPAGSICKTQKDCDIVHRVGAGFSTVGCSQHPDESCQVKHITLSSAVLGRSVPPGATHLKWPHNSNVADRVWWGPLLRVWLQQRSRRAVSEKFLSIDGRCDLPTPVAAFQTI